MDYGTLIDWNSLSPTEQLGRVTQQNNEWSAAQAQKQMDFQREMSDTAHQREVADLKAAGLNPVLSARLGGASTPTGAMGATDTSLTSALVDLLGYSMQAVNSAAGAASAAASGGKGLFGLDLIKNPRQPWQLLYNYIVSGNYEELTDGIKDFISSVTGSGSAKNSKGASFEPLHSFLKYYSKLDFVGNRRDRNTSKQVLF